MRSLEVAPVQQQRARGAGLALQQERHVALVDALEARPQRQLPTPGLPKERDASSRAQGKISRAAGGGASRELLTCAAAERPAPAAGASPDVAGPSRRGLFLGPMACSAVRLASRCLSSSSSARCISFAFAFSLACSGSSFFERDLAALRSISLSESSRRFLSTRSNSSRNLS